MGAKEFLTGAAIVGLSVADTAVELQGRVISALMRRLMRHMAGES